MPPNKQPNPAHAPLFDVKIADQHLRAVDQAESGPMVPGYPGASDTTLRLLNYWFHTDHRLPTGRKFAYHYSQQFATETLIYLYEIAQVRRQKQLIETYAHRQLEAPAIRRLRYQAYLTAGVEHGFALSQAQLLRTEKTTFQHLASCFRNCDESRKIPPNPARPALSLTPDIAGSYNISAQNSSSWLGVILGPTRSFFAISRTSRPYSTC